MDSFWNTEYGQNLLSLDQTEIDRKLSSPNGCTLEELFDEDELLQQTSNKNSELISFLSKQENIRKLISYITRPWQEHMEQIIKYLKEQQQQQPNIDEQNNNDSLPLVKEESVENNLDSTPQALADALMSLEDKKNKQILQHIVNSNIPPTQESETKNDEQNNENKTSQNQNNEDDFECDDDLKLSDDEEENENGQNNDDDNDKNENQQIDDEKNENNNSLSPPPPTLKKKGSIVDMLMDGPDFTDDTELSPQSNQEEDDQNDGDKNEEENQNDADPELPDLDVKKESKSEDSDDEIPPPPPLPRQLSKVEEYESENGIERVKLKYPYLASEIINCQIPQIMDAILDESNPFLEMLFDFIEQPPPLNAVLTNYWRSCVVGLVRRNASIILTYIKSRQKLLASLVQHIRDQSIMELVIALGWDPAIEELKELDEVADWMYSQQLVPKLIATLSPTRSPDEHSAASYTLVDIVAKTSRSTNLVLFHNLASSEQIDALMNHMFAGNRSSLLESLSVLLALLHHYPNVSAEKQQFGENSDEHQHNDIPPPPPDNAPSAPLESDNIDNLQFTESVNPLAPKNVIEKAVEEQSKMKKEEQEKKEESKESTDESKEIEFDPSIPSVVRAVCHRLNEFKILLQTKPTKDLKLPFVHLQPPLGPVRHKVVDMIVALMRTPSKVVSAKLRELGLIKICIDLFFDYPWNNLLHGSVEHIIQMVVSGDCEILKKALFEDCDFLNRILFARECSAKHQETNHFRLGYMGHITRVSNTIVEFAKRNAQLQGYMESNENWMKFIGDDLKLENEQLNTQLGGHRPTQLGDDDGDEFPLFALDNIGGSATDDLLGDNFDENEDVDHDSDSDHSSEEDESDKKEGDYELPQEAFEKLTKKMDAIAQDDDDEEEVIELDMKKKEQNTEELDKWLNADAEDDDWGNFDDVDKEKEKGINENENDDDKVQINETVVDDDFDNWDDDPFADENDLNAVETTDSNNDNNGDKDEKLLNGHIKKEEEENDENNIKQKEVSSIDSVSKIKEIAPSKEQQQQQTAVSVSD